MRPRHPFGGVKCTTAIPSRFPLFIVAYVDNRNYSNALLVCAEPPSPPINAFCVYVLPKF